MSKRQTSAALLSRRYAEALFDLATAQNAVPAVADSMASLKSALESESLKEIITSPLVSASQQKAAVATIAKPLKLHALVERFCTVLAENRRLNLLPTIISAFKTLAQAARGESEVRVTTAQPLTDAARKKLVSVLEKKFGTVSLVEKTDASLLGGMIIRHGSQLLDASLKGKLRRVKSIVSAN